MSNVIKAAHISPVRGPTTNSGAASEDVTADVGTIGGEFTMTGAPYGAQAVIRTHGGASAVLGTSGGAQAAQVALGGMRYGETGHARLSSTPSLLARTLLNTAPLHFISLRRAELVVEQAREDARAMVEAAQAERDAVIGQAQREGYEAGVVEGRNAGAEAVQEEARERLQLLRTIVDDLVSLRDQVAAEYEADIVELALAVAARIVRRESSLGADTVRELLRELLPRTAGTRHITVTVHPEDMSGLEDDVQALASLVDEGAHVSWATDDRLQRGGCFIETERGGIDGTVATRVARIVESLMDVMLGGG